ncbi:hypothetical protein CcrC1_gp109 [Caulobacter phage C1]|nr:hypothetical protein CcrC1_gp109 [Caulobacter phage C1]UTU08337.1 hypothetical protein CcrC2_gp109 [Caulobacter phage C2]UTU08857.1 hypothetical protein CcrJ4_gp106 [Caulobacter phage J4]UTU09411.1 hypothetical protein CcrBL47_gp125 [Caulobacter phage BL47]WGN96996.1 hypothetical protein [Bertelyvirus sp.]
MTSILYATKADVPVELSAYAKPYRDEQHFGAAVITTEGLAVEVVAKAEYDATKAALDLLDSAYGALAADHKALTAERARLIYQNEQMSAEHARLTAQAEERALLKAFVLDHIAESDIEDRILDLKAVRDVVFRH